MNLQSPVRNTAVADIKYHYVMGFVQYLVNNPVISNPDPIERFRSGKFLYIVRDGIS